MSVVDDEGSVVNDNKEEDVVTSSKSRRKLNSRGSSSVRVVVKRGAESSVLDLEMAPGAENDQQGLELEPEPVDEEEEALAQIAQTQLSSQNLVGPENVDATGEVKYEPSVWPDPFEVDTEWPDLSHTSSEIEEWVVSKGYMLIRTVTWNLAAKDPPAVDEMRKTLLPPGKFHIYIIGTEECERSIARSALNPSKKNWENHLGEALGPLYVPLRAHTLQAMHIIAFAHQGISHLCSDITSGCIATGLGGTLGNKGAVALNMKLGPDTTLTVVNAHLAAHQNAVKKRNEEFNKIDKEMPAALSRRLRRSGSFVSASSISPSGTGSMGQPLPVVSSTSGDCDTLEPTQSDNKASLSSSAKRVIFMGDMNYRIRGNREAVDQLIALNMHEVLHNNDQLRWSMDQGMINAEYVEAPLNFKPTYKFDFCSDVYDSGKSQRIPSWTDRILYIKRGLDCLEYKSEANLKTSDHRPVYGSFKVEVGFHAAHELTTPNKKALMAANLDFTSESQVCSLM